MLQIIAFCIALLLGLESAHAEMWENCDRSENCDLTIKGCTAIIQSGNVTPRSLATAYNNRGLAYDDKGDYDSAIADYTKSIELHPDAVTYHNRCVAYRDNGDADSAISDCDQAIKLRPTYADAYNDRGLAYHDRGDFDRAISDYDQAIKFDPDAISYYNRCVTYLDQGDPDRAMPDCDQAIKLNPGEAAAYAARAAAYRDKGDYDCAISEITKTIKLAPNEAAPYLSRAIAYYDKGDLKAAAADTLRAIELKGDGRAILFRYLARLRAGEAAASELDANASRLKTKEWPHAAIELYVGKRTPEATLDAATKPQDRCAAQFYIGEWHLMKGNRSEAIAALKNAAQTCRVHFLEYDAAVAELKRLGPEGGTHAKGNASACSKSE